MAGFGFQNVGFVGSLAPAGPVELFKNFSFDQPATGNNATGWNILGPAVISGGALALNGNGDTTQRVTLVLGARYRLTATLRSCTVGGVYVVTDSGAGSGNGQITAANAANTLSADNLTVVVEFTAGTNNEIYYIRGHSATNALLESLSLIAI